MYIPSTRNLSLAALWVELIAVHQKNNLFTLPASGTAFLLIQLCQLQKVLKIHMYRSNLFLGSKTTIVSCTRRKNPPFHRATSWASKFLPEVNHISSAPFRVASHPIMPKNPLNYDDHLKQTWNFLQLGRLHIHPQHQTTTLSTI